MDTNPIPVTSESAPRGDSINKQSVLAVFFAIGASVFFGYSLGAVGLSNLASKGAVALDQPVDSRTQTAGTFGLKLTCVAVNSARSDGMFLINTTNTKNNPVIIPVPGNGVCDPIITATKDTPSSDYSTKTGGFIKTSGNWYGRDGKEYGTDAIGYDFYSDTTYPRGYLKVYFKDPSTGGSVNPTGSLTFSPIFTKFNSVEILSSNGISSVVIDNTEGQSPISVASNNSNIVYVETGSSPLINANYRLQARQDGVSVLQQISDTSNKVVFKKIVAGGSNITWSPSIVETSGTYLVSLCPVDTTGKILSRAKCAFRSFNIVDTKTD